MKEVTTEFKEATIAVDFDGVIHKYSQGFQGLHNAYDVPYEDARESLQVLKDKGYRLIIVSSRPTDTIREWLDKYEMSHFFDDVSNIKHPAKYYIDDHAIRFERKLDNPWKNVLEFIDYEEKK
jgi:phosphoglycolate phosphatase-like HAD superfamily hydrolase